MCVNCWPRVLFFLPHLQVSMFFDWDQWWNYYFSKFFCGNTVSRFHVRCQKIYRWWLFVFWFWLTAISVLRGLYFYVGKKTSPETRLREGLRNYFFSFSLSYALGGDGVTSGLIHQQLRVNSHHGCLTGVPFSAFLSLPFEAARENVQT